MSLCRISMRPARLSHAHKFAQISSLGKADENTDTGNRPSGVRISFNLMQNGGTLHRNDRHLKLERPKSRRLLLSVVIA